MGLMGARILVVDNYDSFVYTIVGYLAQLGAECDVRRNDAVTTADAAGYDGVLLSPGPGAPSAAGVCPAMVRHCADARQPMLGVCLGHQALGEVFGATVTHAPELMHGKTSPIHHDGRGIYCGLSNPFTATRYHSLAVDRARRKLAWASSLAARTARGSMVAAARSRRVLCTS